MEKKFDKLYESYVSRYTRGGFLTGDLVKLKDGYKTIDCYKHLSDDLKKILDELNASDLNLRVNDIQNKYPSKQPGNTDNSNGEIVLTVTQETAPGRYDGNYTFPSSLFDVSNVYPNLMPIPNSLVRPNKTNIKPEELTGGYEEAEEDYVGQNPLKSQIDPGNLPDKLKPVKQGSDRALKNTNVEIDQFGVANKQDQASPGGGAHNTSIYMK